MSEPVVVFGGTGYVGAGIVRALLRAGWPVVAVSRRGPESRVLGPAPGLRVCKGDAGRPRDWEDLLKGAAAVVNCIGIIREGHGPESTYDRVNYELCKILLEAGIKAGVRGFVYISARTIPGPFLRRYAASKGKAEAFVRSNMPSALILRPGIVLPGPSFIPFTTGKRDLEGEIIAYLEGLRGSDPK